MTKKRKPRPEEERPSEDEQKSLSSWKFDMLETLNADPATSPTEVSVMEAYLHFVRAASRTAYLSGLDLRVRTSISSLTTIWRSRRKLIDLGYLVPNGKTRAGVDVFRLVNARQNLVLDHVAILTERLNEQDVERKRRDRAKSQKTADVRTENGHGGAPRPYRNCTDRYSDNGYKHLEDTPVVSLGTEGRTQSQEPDPNAYARASRGW